MNKFTVYVVVALIILTSILAIVGGFWHSSASTEASDPDNMDAGESGTHFYIELGYDSIVEGFFTFVRYFQLLSLLLPTSLFVTVEILKAFCSYMIVNDI